MMETLFKNGDHRWGQRLLLAVLAGCLCASVCAGSAADSAPTAAPGTAASTNAAPIPLAKVTGEAEETLISLRSMEDSLTVDETTAPIQHALPALAQEASVRLEEGERMLSSSPSLEMLWRMESEWIGLRLELAEWKRTLGRGVMQLESERQRLVQMEQIWDATRSNAPAGKMPGEVLARVEQVATAVQAARAKTEAEQLTVVTLQTRVSDLDGQAVSELDAIERARKVFLRRLFVRDSPPLWSGEIWSDFAGNLARQSTHSFSLQAQALKAYLDRNGERFALQGVLFLLIFAGLSLAGRRLRKLGGDAPDDGARVFATPVATGLVLTLLASGWIYPRAPRLFWAMVAAVALVPTVVVVRRLIDRRLHPVLNALVAFYFVDQVQMTAASQAVLSRGLLLTELACGVLVAAWLNRGATAADDRLRKVIRGTGRVGLAVFGAAFILGVTGYVGLSKLLGHAALQSGYMALILYAAVRIFDGLFAAALIIPPLAGLGLAKRHRALLRKRAQHLLEVAARLLWALIVLETLALRAPCFRLLKVILTAPLGTGSLKITLGDLATFGITVWASFWISRMVRFVLEEEVYPRTRMPRGIHYSISQMVNYVILLFGFLLGVALLGFDLTRLTILVGAFGVGLGFGLQNIINNFVSGLILLFERPIKVGDLVQIGGNEGKVTHIGIRASTIRFSNGSEVIVPNGSFISDTVTNWTYSDRLRRIDVQVSVLGPADAVRVMDLLKGVAAQEPQINPEPPPQALLIGFVGDAMTFELRCWTSHAEDWPQIRSALTLAVRATLAEHKIPMK